MNMFGFDPSQFQYGPDGTVLGYGADGVPATFDTGIASLAPENPDSLSMVDPRQVAGAATGTTSTELYPERDTDDLFNADGTAGTPNPLDIHPLPEHMKAGIDQYDMTDAEKLAMYNTVAYGFSNPGIGSFSGLNLARPNNTILPIEVENPDPIYTPRPEPPPSVVVDPVDPVDPFVDPEPAPVVEPVAPPVFVADPPVPPPPPVVVVPNPVGAPEIDPVNPVVVPPPEPIMVDDPDPFGNPKPEPDPDQIAIWETLGLDGVMYPNAELAAAADAIYLDKQLEKRKSRLDLAMNSDFGMGIRSNTGIGLAGNEVIAPEFGDLPSHTDSGKYNPFADPDRISPTYGALPTSSSNGRTYGATGLTELNSNVFSPTAPRTYGRTMYTVDDRDPFANPFLRGIGSIQRAGGG